jgi:pimeloyl-ACP methyl ester carboxylesterase
VLWGEGSPFLLESGLVGLEQLAPDLTIKRIPGATHWVTMQQPALAIQHIRDFLASKGKS